MKPFITHRCRNGECSICPGHGMNHMSDSTKKVCNHSCHLIDDNKLSDTYEHLYNKKEETMANYIFDHCKNGDHVNCVTKTFSSTCTCDHHKIDELIEQSKQLNKQAMELINKGFNSKVNKVNEYPEDMIWTSSDGRKIPIPEMPTPHLVNTLNWIKASIELIVKQKSRMYQGDLDHLNKKVPVTGVDRLSNALSVQLDKDALEYLDLNYKAIGQDILPQYGNLINEARKRKFDTNILGEYLLP